MSAVNIWNSDVSLGGQNTNKVTNNCYSGGELLFGDVWCILSHQGSSISDLEDIQWDLKGHFNMQANVPTAITPILMWAGPVPQVGGEQF